MNLHMHSDAHTSQNNTERTPPALSPSPVATPTKSSSRGPLIDLTGWPSYSDRRTQAPGGGAINGGVHQSGGFSSEAPSIGHALGMFQNPSHLATPQSPGNMSSYLRNPLTSSLQNSQPVLESSMLPTEFPSYPSPSSPPQFRPQSFPTPESSPLVARSRGNGFHPASQPLHTGDDNNGFPTLSKRKTSQSRESTPIPVRPPSTRPVTPCNPPASVQWAPTRLSMTRTNNAASDDPVPISPSPHRVQDEAEGEIPGIRAQLIENHLALAQAAQLRRPEYFKRVRRMTQDPESSSSAVAGGASLLSDIGGKNASLLWASANIGVIDSPMKGRRITLFQETSDESFEESLMAGGYGRYRSDRPWWKPEQDAEVPDRPGDTMGFGSGLVLSEEEKRKKARLSAFFDPPLASSSKTPLFPVEIEGCGRVLMKLEPSESQPPPKPSSSKAKRSRKRKKVFVEQKQDLDKESAVAEGPKIDGPNWPDTEFPWRSWSQDGFSIAEREERLRHIESFLDRDSDEEDSEEGQSSSRRSPDGLSSRSPRPGQGKMYPLLSHSKDRRHRSITLAIVPSDPADAKTALLSKKSVRAVQQRLLSRQIINPDASSDEGETVCICQGRDDGRPLVQCDACQTWYHLECIGIQSMSELGREEDPWFCANCVEVKTPPPVTMALSEPTFMQTEDEDGRRGSVGPEGGYDPPLFNASLNPSPTTLWTRATRPPTTPPRLQKGSSWEEPSSSSSRGGPRTPQFNTPSAFGDMVRVYGTAPGRSLEASSSSTDEFDPTSTPSRGIKFGVPFTTPKDGMWGSSWQGVRGVRQEFFHTPHDGGGQPVRYGQHLLYPARVEEVSEERRSGPPGNSWTGPNDTTPVERDATRGPLRMQVLESPLGKRSRRTINS